MDWLSAFKDLPNLKDGAKLTLPAALCATLLIVFFWPPKPIDVIPVVKSDMLQIGLPKLWQPPFGNFVRHELQPRAPYPACQVDEYYLDPPSELTGLLFKEHNDNAQRRQYALEEQKENTEKCLAAESRLLGSEQADNTALERYLKTLEESRAREAIVVADYEESDSPMLPLARAQLDAAESAIDAERRQIAKNQQSARDRDWEMAELTRWKTVISDRLADPGRLRPELGFDDYLSALSKHVLAFIFLALVVGMVIEGISTPWMLKVLESILFGS